MRLAFLILLLFPVSDLLSQDPVTFIRINQLGYPTAGIKVAVWCSMERRALDAWSLVDASSGKAVLTGKPGKGFGRYGPFRQTYRMDFSAFNVAGKYYLEAGGARSPQFVINDDAYKGAADFCLRY